MQGRIIVLSGEAGAGKDSVAKVLVSRGWHLFSLTDEAKRFAERVFGWDKERLYGPSSKRNEPDPKWARDCTNCGGRGTYEHVPYTFSQYDDEITFQRRVCRECTGTGKINDNSARRVLQLLCCEWARDMIHPDIWTLSNVDKIKGYLDIGACLVVNDARFSNDRNNLASWFGAKRVHVTSTRPKKDADWRNHKSENDQPSDDQVEYVLNNGDETWPYDGMPARVNNMLECLYGK